MLNERYTWNINDKSQLNQKTAQDIIDEAGLSLVIVKLNNAAEKVGFGRKVIVQDNGVVLDNEYPKITFVSYNDIFKMGFE
jgi:transcriptional regulator of NAD metabolism